MTKEKIIYSLWADIAVKGIPVIRKWGDIILTHARKVLGTQGEQKEVNLVEVLKHYPKETELYSPLYGKLWLAEVDEQNEIITCYKYCLGNGCTRAALDQEETVSFYSNGTTGLPDCSVSKDCMLFLYDIKNQSEKKTNSDEPKDYNSIDPHFGKPIGKSALEAIKEEKVDNANKIEPKFKVGDWVVNNNGKVNQVVSVGSDGDGYTLDDDTYFSGSWGNLYHLWTIEDAKDGDILVHNDGTIFIYSNRCNLQAYCYYSKEVDRFTIEEGGHICRWNMQEATPATKEQRDKLMKAMADAGYDFDFDKKELKKIEQKSDGWSKEDESILNGITAYLCTHDSCELEGFGEWYDWLKSLKDRVIPQPTQEWSDEDEKMNHIIQGALQNTLSIKYIEAMDKKLIESLNWLENIKNRVLPQSKQEWNEEDEEQLNNCIGAIHYTFNEEKNITKLSEWLKSLKDRVQPKEEWSEEDEQIRQKLILFISSPNTEALLLKDQEQQFLDWLKSLRPQNHRNWTKDDEERYKSCLQRLGTGNPKQPETINSKWFKEHVGPQNQWKPSDKQIEALEHFVRSLGESGFASPYEDNTKLMYSLLQDLKKLKD